MSHSLSLSLSLSLCLSLSLSLSLYLSLSPPPSECACVRARGRLGVHVCMWMGAWVGGWVGGWVGVGFHFVSVASDDPVTTIELKTGESKMNCMLNGSRRIYTWFEVGGRWKERHAPSQRVSVHRLENTENEEHTLDCKPRNSKAPTLTLTLVNSCKRCRCVDCTCGHTDLCCLPHLIACVLMLCAAPPLPRVVLFLVNEGSCGTAKGTRISRAGNNSETPKVNVPRPTEPGWAPTARATAKETVCMVSTVHYKEACKEQWHKCIAKVSGAEHNLGKQDTKQPYPPVWQPAMLLECRRFFRSSAAVWILIYTSLYTPKRHLSLHH